MNANINKEVILGAFLTLLFYFLLGLCGAFVKDLYDFMCGKQKKIMIHEIIIAATTTSFISLGIQDFVVEKYGFNFMITINFLIGVLGFEIFTCFNTIQGIRQFLSDFKEFKKTKK